jgi:hypothetical protein
LQHFEKYLETGYYPFYREEGDGFFDRLQQVIETIVTSEIPSVSNIEYDSVYKAKQLLAVLAESSPYTLNISGLCVTLQASRNNVLKRHWCADFTMLRTKQTVRDFRTVCFDVVEAGRIVGDIGKFLWLLWGNLNLSKFRC